MGSIINDVQVGQNTRISIQSKTHGRKRIPLAQTLSFTDKESSGAVDEFDNRYAAIAWQTFDSTEVSVEVMQADQADMDAMIMDQDPNIAVVNFDKAQISPVTIWCNYTGRNTGYTVAADYAEGLVCHSSPGSSTVNAPTKRTYGFTGTRHLHLEGKTGQKCAIQYTRFVNTPTYVSTDDVTLTGAGNKSGGFPQVPSSFPIGGGLSPTTQNYIQAIKTPSGGNPTVLAYTTDFTISNNVLTLVANTAAGDVVEIWTVVYASVT